MRVLARRSIVGAALHPATMDSFTSALALAFVVKEANVAAVRRECDKGKCWVDLAGRWTVVLVLALVFAFAGSFLPFAVPL